MGNTVIPLDAGERRILTITSTAHMLCHFFMLVFPPLVMPMSRELGVPVATVLSYSFWMYMLYGVLAIPWGWVSDHWGHRWAMGTGIALAGMGFVAAALARSAGALSLSFALVGIGCSAYHPSGIAMVSQGIRQRGRALGINGVFGNVGIAAPPFVVGLLNYALGWRISVAIVGALGLVAGAVALSLRYSVEREADKKVVEALDPATARRLFIVVCVGLAIMGLVYRSFTVILPAYLEERLGDVTAAVRRAAGPAVRDSVAFDTLAANLVATVIYILGMIGQLVGGRVADRRSLKWAYLVFILIALPFLFGVALLPGAMVAPSAAIFVMFFLGVQSIENSVVAYLTPARWRSVSFGVKFTLTFGVGALAVKLMETVESRYGVTGAIWPAPLFLVLMVINLAVFVYLARNVELRH